MSPTPDQPEGSGKERSAAVRCGDVIFIDDVAVRAVVRITRPSSGHRWTRSALPSPKSPRTPGDLAFLRLFYVDDGLVEEAGLLDALADRLPPSGSRVAVTLVPVQHLGGSGRLVRLEGVAMRGADGGRPARAYAAGERDSLPDRLAGGVRCEGFIFLGARSQPRP
jgi:hypothetical protein